MTRDERVAAGGSAFPTFGYGDGLTLRDHFAAQALVGVLAAHAGDGVTFPSDEKVTKWAFGYADAMMSERKKVEPSEVIAD